MSSFCTLRSPSTFLTAVCCLFRVFRSAIKLPHTDYPLFDSLPASVVDTGKLSELQLEGVLYACSV